MKILTCFFKYILLMLFYIIKKSKDSITYIFEVVLKKELTNYLETKYYRGFIHIEKVIAVAQKLKSPGEIIVDIGGSTGHTAILFSKAFHNVSIYVFEPVNESFRKLQETVNSIKNIMPINTAVGNFRGETKININDRISSSSLLDLNPALSGKTNEINFKTERSESVKVNLLDELIPTDKNVLIAKIDVQGYEMEVLKGGKNTLKRTKLIVIEVSNHTGYLHSTRYYEIDEFLRDLNFTLFDIFPSIHERGKLIEWDVIYKRTSYQ